MRDEVSDTVIHGQAPILIGIQRAIAVGILEPSACYGEHRLDSRTDDRLCYWSLIVARTAGALPLSVTTATRLAVMWVVSVGLLAATGGSGNDEAPIAQPVIGARVKTVLTIAGRRFKDSNANGVLEPYEDWRLAADDRVSDLLARMTLEEKAV